MIRRAAGGRTGRGAGSTPIVGKRCLIVTLWRPAEACLSVYLLRRTVGIGVRAPGEDTMHRSVSTAIITMALGLAGLSAASAQSEQGLAHGQGVLHRAVCPGPADTGTARCHAHVVTDKSNNPIES